MSSQDFSTIQIASIPQLRSLFTQTNTFLNKRYEENKFNHLHINESLQIKEVIDENQNNDPDKV